MKTKKLVLMILLVTGALFALMCAGTSIITAPRAATRTTRTTACIFCGIVREIVGSATKTTVWWNEGGGAGTGMSICDDHGGFADAYEKEVSEGGFDYIVFGVRCNDGTEFETDRVLIGPSLSPSILPVIVFAYQEPAPAGNWWDGWDGDCNNPPVDPSGQETWSWC